MDNFFSETRDLLTKFLQQPEFKPNPGRESALCSEVSKRLKQMSFLLSRINKLELEASKPNEKYHQQLMEYTKKYYANGKPIMDRSKIPDPPSPPPGLEKVGDIMEEVELLTESFYYIAARARSIIRQGEAPLHVIKRFEAKGVRNVRNHLIEHSEKKRSGIVEISFGMGAEKGPVLKCIRETSTEDIFPDQGLYINAKEFKDNLESILIDKIASVDDGSGHI